MNKIKLLKLLITLVVLVGVVVFSIRLDRSYRKEKVVQIGLTKGQNEYFQEHLKETGVFFSPYKRARYLYENNRLDEALTQYKVALDKAYSDPTRALAVKGLADVYEKKRDYSRALEYVVLDRDEYINDWASAPVIMRVKYLEYAAKGEYELAVEAADKALIVETNMPYNKGVPSSEYVQRVNDLKASKAYIESLKKKNN